MLLIRFANSVAGRLVAALAQGGTVVSEVEH